MDPAYLGHVLNVADYRGFVNGTTRLKLTKSAMLNMRVELPSLVEQRRRGTLINGLLGEIDLGDERLNSSSRSLTLLEASAMAAAFNGELTGGPPEKIRPLKELATVQSGITKGRKKVTATLNLPYLRTANVQAGYLSLDEVKSIDATPEQVVKNALKDGDVLILEGGDADKVGRGWIWEAQIDPCLHQNHVFAVRPDPGQLQAQFLAYYVNSPAARRYFLGVAKQSTNLASINKKDLNALPVPRFSIVDQHEIVAILNSLMDEVRDKKATIRSAGERARQLRHAAIEAVLSDPRPNFATIR